MATNMPTDDSDAGQAPPARAIAGIIGSTGAVEALRAILAGLSPDMRGTVAAAQHMFSPVWRNFTEVLAQSVPCPAALACGGEIVREGRIYLSPTDRTLLFTRTHRGGITVLEEVVPKKGQLALQPNLDAFLESLASCYGQNALGIVLSGIGEGGKEGARAIREAGGQVWAQDPGTAVAASMPQAVVDASLADRVLDVKDMVPALIEFFRDR